MKRLIFIVLPIVILVGCTNIKYNEKGDISEKTEFNPVPTIEAGTEAYKVYDNSTKDK